MRKQIKDINIKFSSIAKIRHRFFHSWVETGWGQENVEVTRKCKFCAKEQRLLEVDYGGGVFGATYSWEDIE